jgi:glycosyltransferase involved in cell wall biosynthesis
MRKWMVFFVCVVWVGFASAAEPKESTKMGKKTVCLNMIVKDEAKVIERCLGSLKHIVDYWVIVDTGSSDGTQEIIKNFLLDVPGELHERPWVDFAHNRNEAIQLAKNKGDYLLLIDADEVLEFEPNFKMPALEKDVYFITLRQLNAADARRNGIINNRIDWKWEGVIHEVLVSEQAKTSEVLQGVRNVCNLSQESGRSLDPKKYLKDAQVLENALKKEPNNSRYMYYLGVSYAACDKHELARQAFEKRAAMASGDIQETYMSIYNVAVCNERMEKFDAAIEGYFKAHEFRPSRAEPIFHAAVLYRKKGNILLGYLLSKHALGIPRPTEDLCVEYMAYDYATLIEFANCALLLGKFREGLEACNQLLSNPGVPGEMKPHVLKNAELAQERLKALALQATAAK